MVNREARISIVVVLAYAPLEYALLSLGEFSFLVCVIKF